MSAVMIFELDGGTWDVISPMIEAGRLPHLARLKQQGAWGTLRSIRPMVSPALWATIFTGKRRAQHGVRTFDAGSRQIRCKRVWDIAHEQGLSCGICSSLSTWPPYDVGAFMIPDIMARGPETFPPELTFLQEVVLRQMHAQGRGKEGGRHYARSARALRRVGVQLGTIWTMAQEVVLARLGRPPRDSYWRRALLLQQMYADVFQRLYTAHRPALATYHYHAVDTISHKYWHDAFPEAFGRSGGEDRYRHVVHTAYAAADRVLGQILRSVGPDTTVVVLSDHGFQATPGVRSRHTARLARWIEILDLKEVVVPTRLGRQHFLYFDDATLIEPTAQILASARIRETGKPALRTVETREDSLFFEPDLAWGGGTTVVIPNRGEWPFEALFQDTGHVTSAVHHQEGVVIVAGPPIRPGVALGERSILDVTPNLLALLGLPLARDMEGEVWRAMLRAEAFDAASWPVVDTYETTEWEGEDLAYSEEERDELYDRLESLGYL